MQPLKITMILLKNSLRNRLSFAPNAKIIMSIGKVYKLEEQMKHKPYSVNAKMKTVNTNGNFNKESSRMSQVKKTKDGTWQVIKPKHQNNKNTRNYYYQNFKSGASNSLMDTYAPTFKNPNLPVEVTYTREEYAEACARGLQLGHLKNSITKGKSNVWGMLGEAVVAKYTGATLADTYQYDLITPKGEKLEVKTKKTTLTTAPKPHFECSVCQHNSRQQCDYYVFVRVSTNSNKAWICGQIEKDKLKQTARFFKKGDYDPSNNYKVHASCWNLNIAELDPVLFQAA